MAARFGATIVPFAGIGSEDAVTMLADSEEIRSIPILGERIAQRSRETIPQARRYGAAWPTHKHRVEHRTSLQDPARSNIHVHPLTAEES